MSLPVPPAIPEEFAQIFGALEDGITLRDGSTGKLLYANALAAALAGFDSPDEMLAATLEELRGRCFFTDALGQRLPYEALPEPRVLVGEFPAPMNLRCRIRATHEEHWVQLTSLPLTTEAGLLRCVVCFFRVTTDHRRDERAFRLLGEASSLLTHSLDYRAGLHAMLRRLIPDLADGGTLVLTEEDGTLLEDFFFADPAREAAARELHQRDPLNLDSLGARGDVPRPDQVGTIRASSEDVSDRLVQDQEHQALLQRRGYREAFTVPLRIRGRVVGALTLALIEPGRRFDPDDIALVREISERAAEAVDNARLYLAAQRALRRKEEEARNSERLRRISTSLASELDPDVLAQRICDEITALVGARTGALFHQVLGAIDDAPRCAFSGSALDGFIALGPPQWNDGLFGRTFQGENVLFTDLAQEPVEMLGPTLSAALIRSYLAVPLLTRAGDVVGGVFFGHTAPNRFTPAHQQLVADICAQATVALDNAHLFQQLRVEEVRSRESNERLRLSLEIGKLGYFQMELSPPRVFISPRLQEIHGLPPGTVETTPSALRDTFHPEDRLLATQQMERLRRNATLPGTWPDTEPIQYRVLHPDGTVRYVEGYTQVLAAQDGHPRFLGVREDVTERIMANEQARRLEAEQAARESAEAAERRIVAILDSIGEPLLSLDAAGRFRFLNRSAEARMGKTREALLGRNARDEPPFSTTEGLLDFCLRASQIGQRVEIQERLFDGNFYEIRASPMEGGVTLYLRDLSIQIREREMQERLAHSEALRADVGTAVASEASTPEVLLRCAEAMVHHLKVELVQMWLCEPLKRTLELAVSVGPLSGAQPGPVPETIPQSPQASPAPRMPLPSQNATERKALVTQRLPEETPDETRAWLAQNGLAAMANYPLQVGEVFVGVCQIYSRTALAEEVTTALAALTDVLAQGIERRRVERSRDAQAQELTRSNAELERLAYVASHDLQEPLRMVASYTQLLARRYQGKLDQDANDFINYAVDGVNRMKRLMQDLLDYSRVGTGTQALSPVSLERAFQEACSNLGAAIAENEAQVTTDPLPVLHGEPLLLTRLFQNLIGNALKFHGERAPQVHVSARRTGSEWIISVRDNGIGIDPQYFHRIFVIFQRLHGKDEYPGTGIGLAICKKIVERHSGRIWVESKPGDGATFLFALPAQEALVTDRAQD